MGPQGGKGFTGEVAAEVSPKWAALQGVLAELRAARHTHGRRVLVVTHDPQVPKRGVA